MDFDEKDFLSCCGTSKFAKQMALASPFESLEDAISTARDIWFNKMDVSSWLEAIECHPQIGGDPSPKQSETSAQWSRGEQSTAMATASDSHLLEFYDWNARYMQKFGFMFLICATGRTASEILPELKKRYTNRPIVEFEIAAREELKIAELRLAKLFATKGKLFSTKGAANITQKMHGLSIIGALSQQAVDATS